MKQTSKKVTPSTNVVYYTNTTDDIGMTYQHRTVLGDTFSDVSTAKTMVKRAQYNGDIAAFYRIETNISELL